MINTVEQPRGGHGCTLSHKLIFKLMERRAQDYRGSEALIGPCTVEMLVFKFTPEGSLSPVWWGFVCHQPLGR